MTALPRHLCHMLILKAGKRPAIHSFMGHLQVCELLLEYCLSDLGPHLENDALKLDGLPLLAMGDGTLGSLRAAGASAARPAYVMTSQDARILAKQSHCIVSWHVSPAFLLGPRVASRIYRREQCRLSTDDFEESPVQCAALMHPFLLNPDKFGWDSQRAAINAFSSK